MAEPESRDIRAEKIVAGSFQCPSDVAQIIVGAGHRRGFLSGSPILHQGDRITSAHFVMSGRARALLYGGDGQVILLHEYRQGELFGSLGEAEAHVQDADVVAIDDVQVLMFDGRDLARLAQQHGCIGLALSRMLLNRLRTATTRMYERAAMSAVDRVHAELLRLARREPNMVIRPAPVLTDIALRAGTTRETVSRVVNDLQRRGIIARDDTMLRIIAPQRLDPIDL